MNKTLLALLAPLLCCAALPDLKEYTDANKTFDTRPVFSESFDRPMQNWIQPAVFRIARGEGFNGTNALYYERTDKKQYPMMRKRIPLDGRMEYECSFLLRTEDINFHDTNQTAFKDQVGAMGIQYHDNGKWVGISPSFAKHKPMKPGEWQKVTFPVRQPAGTRMTASFDLYMRSGITGKMWIDDIVVKPVGMTSALIWPVASSLRLDEKGTITMKAVAINAKNPSDPALALFVDAGGRKQLLRGKNGVYQGDFGTFAPGEVMVQVKLLDTAKKQILASDVYKYYATAQKKPRGAAVLDSHGRLLVDGKPFMPIAAFSGFRYPPTIKDIRRLKDAGFNTLMYYHPFKYMWIAGKKATQKENILTSLDELQKQDMKLIFAVFRQNFPNQPGSRMEFDKIRGLDNVTNYVLDFVRNHPAILAYYLSDENPLEEYPSVKRLRELVGKADPWHPTVTLTCRRDYFQQCAHTGDIFSYDYYPINTDKDQSFSYDGLKEASAMGVPHWFTSQAFHWGSPRKHHKYNTYRYPTEEEMRSMNLAAAIFDSKGFLFYSYADIREQEEKLDPVNGPKFWIAVAEVSRLLRELEPWIMSMDKAPEVRVKQKHSGKAEVIARAFSAAGKPCVMIVSNGPEKASAEIFVPGHPDLKSKYGRTKNLGGGNYLFSGDNIASDVLMQP